MVTPRCFVIAVLAAQIVVPVCARSQQSAAPPDEFVRAHYTKYEYRIPMRDGVQLFTAVYVPKASAFPDDPGPYPFLMDRTPYSVGALRRRPLSCASRTVGRI